MLPVEVLKEALHLDVRPQSRFPVVGSQSPEFPAKAAPREQKSAASSEKKPAGQMSGGEKAGSRAEGPCTEEGTSGSRK